MVVSRSVATVAAETQAASAGRQVASAPKEQPKASAPAKEVAKPSVSLSKERLWANPNLPQVFKNGGRDQIRRQVDVLTTEGRLSMYILAALPICIAIYMLLVNRSYISLLWKTTPGLVMLVTGISLLTVGIIWMKRIVKIDV